MRVKISNNGTVMGALYKGFIASAVLSFIGIFLVIDCFIGMDTTFTFSGGTFSSMDIFLCSLVDYNNCLVINFLPYMQF